MSQEVERSSTRPRPLQQSTCHVVLGRDTECCVLTVIAPDERVEPRSCGEMLTCDKGALDKYSPFTIHRVTGLALCRQIDVLILPSDTMHCPWNTVWFSKVLAVNTVNNFIVFGHSLHFKVPWNDWILFLIRSSSLRLRGPSSSGEKQPYRSIVNDEESLFYPLRSYNVVRRARWRRITY